MFNTLFRLFCCKRSESTVVSTRVNEKKPIRPPISTALRLKVWRNFNQSSLDGKCFSCTSVIHFERWHCGHIKSHFDGGETTVENLRPICVQCNLKMGTMNLYEYMFLNNLPGCSSLNRANKHVKIQYKMAQSVKIALDKLEKSKIPKAQAKEYKKLLLSKRKTSEERREIIILIDNLVDFEFV